MPHKIDYKKEDLLFSQLCGANLYRCSKGSRQEATFDESLLPIIRHDSGEVLGVCFYKTLNQPLQSQNWNTTARWYEIVQNPPGFYNFRWPIDYVISDEGQENGLVFHLRMDDPDIQPLKKFLYQEKLLDWRFPQVKMFLSNFLNEIASLHKTGFAYHRFDLDHIFYRPQSMELLFGFSLGVSAVHEDPLRTGFVPWSHCDMTFLPPWLVSELDHCQEQGAGLEMDLCCDLYSIAAILFRAMIGRMPYQGRLMDGKGHLMNSDFPEEIGVARIAMMRSYLKNATFIFDPQRPENSLADFGRDQTCIERWNALPKEIQEMFLQVFREDAATYDSSMEGRQHWLRKLYSPATWLNKLQQHHII